MVSPTDGRVPLEIGVVDLQARVLTRTSGETVRLTPTEAALLRHLVRFSGQTVPRADLLRDVWGYKEGVRTRTVDTTMRRLRRKVELVPGVPRHLLTDEGTGYRFVPRHELPVDSGIAAPLDATVGRESELELLDQLAEGGARLVSIVGPGGVGKTRLAREWTRSRKALEVALSDIDHPEGITAAIAAAAGTNPVALPELCARLAHRGVEWVVLDDVEHLVPEVGRIAQGMARDDLRVLVTSRCALQVAGVTRVDLSPLDTAAGVALLRTRSPATLGPAPDTVLAEIVARLDGLPLALEMAAARASLLGAEGLRDRLARPAAVLALSENGPKRRTLASVAQWSWDLLPTSAREALQCLAVFRGGFTVEAAEAVIAQPDALGALQVLRDQSWLRRRGDHTPWRLDLLVPLRTFLRDHIGVDPSAAARHLAHFASLGEDPQRDATERASPDARRQLALEWHNLLAAIDHGLGSGELEQAASVTLAAWDVTRLGRPPDALLPRTERILGGLPRPSPWRYRLMVVLAELRRRETDVAIPLGLAEEAARIAEAAGDVRWTARAHAVAAVALQEHSRYTDALHRHQQALTMARAAGSVRIEGLVLSNMGNLRQRQGNLTEARACLEQAVSLFETGDFERYAAISRGNLAVVWHDLGELELAEACYVRSLDTHEAHGNQRYQGIVSGNLGELALDRGDPQGALEYLTDAITIHRELADPRLEAIVRLSQAEAHRMLGNVDEARTAALDSGTLSRRAGSRSFQFSAEGLLVELSRDPDRTAGLRRLVGLIHELDTMGSDAAAHISRCRLVRVWARQPETPPAELGLHVDAPGLLAEVRAFLTAQGMSRRSEVGRHLIEAEAAWQARST